MRLQLPPVPCREPIVLQGTLPLQPFPLLLPMMGPRAPPGTRKGAVGCREELLAVLFFLCSDMGKFTHWRNFSWTHIRLSEIHRRGDFPKNAAKMSEKFTPAFCLSPAHLMDHLACPEMESLGISAWHVPSCHGGENTAIHLLL